MTDRTPFPIDDTAPRLTHPLAEMPSLDWPMLMQAQTMLDRLLAQIERGVVR